MDLYEIYRPLKEMGLVKSKREFAEQWLGREKNYVNQLSRLGLKPSANVLLRVYAQLQARGPALQPLAAIVWEAMQQ